MLTGHWTWGTKCNSKGKRNLLFIAAWNQHGKDSGKSAAMYEPETVSASWASLEESILGTDISIVIEGPGIGDSTEA